MPPIGPALAESAAGFEHKVLGERATAYSVAPGSGALVVTATGRDSASGLYRRDVRDCFPSFPTVTWSWRVDAIQQSADLRSQNADDFAASLHFVFGERGMVSRPKVLAYAWTAMDVPQGTVIASPRVPDHFRTLVLRAHAAPLMTWRMQRRNVLKDFQKAYGALPERRLTAFGVFTDNDQTKEAVRAVYRLCGRTKP